MTVEYGDCEIKASPLELAAASRNPEMMSLIIEKKHPTIDMDTFDIVFKSNCEECFDVLLDHSNLTWTFNHGLFEKIQTFSVDNENYFVFISRLSKKLGFNDKLALIENAFNTCSDHEKIILTVDAVLLDVTYRASVSEYSGKDELTAVVSFTRAMVFKKDFDDMLSWIDLLYYEYRETEISKMLIGNYKEHVNRFDNRVEDYPQPEDIIMRDDFQVNPV